MTTTKCLKPDCNTLKCNYTCSPIGQQHTNNIYNSIDKLLVDYTNYHRMNYIPNANSLDSEFHINYV